MILESARAAKIAIVAMTWAWSGKAATQRPLIVTSQDHSLVDSDDEAPISVIYASRRHLPRRTRLFIDALAAHFAAAAGTA